MKTTNVSYSYMIRNKKRFVTDDNLSKGIKAVKPYLLQLLVYFSVLLNFETLHNRSDALFYKSLKSE